MLLVKTYIGQSSINGMGLFADQFIPKGTVIWRFNPDLDRIYPKSMVKDMEDSFLKSFLKRYCYLDEDKKKPYYVLCVDDARFMNHSDNPNTSNGDGDQTINNRDIQPSEEITCNYYEIDDDAKNKLR
jgi:uncharacterized protein